MKNSLLHLFKLISPNLYIIVSLDTGHARTNYINILIPTIYGLFEKTIVPSLWNVSGNGMEMLGTGNAFIIKEALK